MAEISLEHCCLVVPRSFNFNQRGLLNRTLLHDLNFHIPSGRNVGVVGLNGSGKSTLLRLLMGIYQPTAGSIKVDGSIGGLIDNGIGFEAESTGSDNIFYRSYLLGKSHAEIKRHFASIAEFSELGPDLSKKLKHYSTGMGLRLNFAISTQWSSEIMVFDEIVGAGDKNFISKSKARINNNIHNASINVIASHNEGLLKEYCDYCIWLDQGRVIAYDKIDSVLASYNACPQ